MSEPESLIKRIVLNEIAGKNRAIHAYDKMIMTVRTGFLTLVFAGWGLLLSSIARNQESKRLQDFIGQVWPLIVAMVAVSVTLAVAGLVVDLNYVRRKFRVISALNSLVGVIIGHDETELSNREFVAKHLKPLLSVSGDSGSRDYISLGYKGARNDSLLIYTLPVVGLLAAITVLNAGR